MTSFASANAQHYNVWQYLGAKLDFNTEPPTYTINKDGSDDQASRANALNFQEIQSFDKVVVIPSSL